VADPVDKAAGQVRPRVTWGEFGLAMLITVALLMCAGAAGMAMLKM
jgi:hypothetical protein